MSLNKKENQYLGLDKLNVYKEDTKPTSKYFKVSGIPDNLTIGKSSFVIRGSKFLKQESELRVEVIDSKGGVIYSEFVKDTEQSNGRPVTIEVYEETPVGMATVHIVGEMKGVPRKWRGIYNVRWSKNIFVDSTQFNKEPIKFKTKPKIAIQEKNLFLRQFHSESIETRQLSSSYYTDGTKGEVEFVLLSDFNGMNTAIEKFPNYVRNLKKKYGKDYLTSDYLGTTQLGEYSGLGKGYAIGYLRGLNDNMTGSFSSEMIGHNFSANKTITSIGTLSTSISTFS